MAGLWRILAVLIVLLINICTVTSKYKPSWDSLDSRPLPAWYDEAKIGIFMHWGLFSVPSYGVGASSQAARFWQHWAAGYGPIVEFAKKCYRPDATYADLAPLFQAELYDPDEWAELFKDAGAKYVVLVTKHHEGFTNWPSNYSWNWNAYDVGPRRDLVGDLARSVRKKSDIHFGVYHSLYEFLNPIFLRDQANNFTTRDFVTEKTMPELYELVNTYLPDLIWSDGDWMADEVYWGSREFLAWLYNDSPVKDKIIVNDRWSETSKCKHGGYWTCTDSYNPKFLQKHKWECATPLEHSWGFRRNAKLHDYKTMEDITQLIAEVISCGGNLLLNIGPTHDGRIVPIYEERLRQLGSWMNVNGEAIYSSKPWKYQNDTVTPGVWYTSKKSSNGTDVYAIMLDWPDAETLDLGSATPTSDTMVTMLGYPTPFKWAKRSGGGMVINVPPIAINKLPCQWAWVFKLQKLY